MKKTILGPLYILSTFLFALLFAQPVFAHGGEPRLEISVERINPGGVMEVRGVDFDYDEFVALSLMRSKIQIPIAEVTADTEGVFTQIIVLPADLPVGEYSFRARTDHHMVMSPIITVWGAAVQEQEDSAVREQSDLQLGPMPTFAPGVVPEGVTQSAADATAQNALPSRGNSTMLMVSSLLVVVFLILLGSRITKKQ